jgi:hypothetical protein
MDGALPLQYLINGEFGNCSAGKLLMHIVKILLVCAVPDHQDSVLD